MSKLRVSISMSLDGYVAGPNQSVENPLGEGGEALHEWAVDLELDGGTTFTFVTDGIEPALEHARAAVGGG